MRIIKYSVRSFLKTPGFTAAALATLALTAGAAATIFSVVNSTVIQPLRFRDAGRLAIVWHRNTQDGQDRIRGQRESASEPRAPPPPDDYVEAGVEAERRKT